MRCSTVVAQQRFLERTHALRLPICSYCLGPSKLLVVVTNGDILSIRQFPFVLGDQGLVYLDLGCLCELADKLEIVLVGEASSKPQEWLLKIVIAPGREVIILQVALPMELDLLGFHLSIFHVNFVSDQYNGNVFTHPDNVTVPIGDILVGDARSDVKHDDGTLTLDVITIAQTTEFFLSCSVPDVECQLPAICEELQGVHFHTQRWDVLLLELTSQMALHKRGFAHTTIAAKNQLELHHSSHVGLAGWAKRLKPKF